MIRRHQVPEPVRLSLSTRTVDSARIGSSVQVDLCPTLNLNRYQTAIALSRCRSHCRNWSHSGCQYTCRGYLLHPLNIIETKVILTLSNEQVSERMVQSAGLFPPLSGPILV